MIACTDRILSEDAMCLTQLREVRDRVIIQDSANLGNPLYTALS